MHISSFEQLASQGHLDKNGIAKTDLGVRVARQRYHLAYRLLKEDLKQTGISHSLSLTGSAATLFNLRPNYSRCRVGIWNSSDISYPDAITKDKAKTGNYPSDLDIFPYVAGGNTFDSHWPNIKQSIYERLGVLVETFQPIDSNKYPKILIAGMRFFLFAKR
ncbi:MAG: hypothetical protein WCP97_08690 [bacterium]